MHKNNFVKGAIFLLLFFMMGCPTHSYLISESYLPVSEHRKAAVAVIGPARIVSQNGREITSHYHDRNFKYIDDMAKTKVRYYTKVIVLGARRPYEVSVEVFKEIKDPETKQFVDQGLDEGLSQKRLTEVAKMLNQSRDNPQSIDVENPF
ncbi:MAG: hypothetical protein H7256_08600 [Bdellovibrio sp.]|nr:hypothetical protein [Bdellovibrio sp.]